MFPVFIVFCVLSSSSSSFVAWSLWALISAQDPSITVVRAANHNHLSQQLTQFCSSGGQFTISHQQSWIRQTGPANVQIIPSDVTRHIWVSPHKKWFSDPDSEAELFKPGWSVGPAASAASWVGGQVRGGVRDWVLGRFRVRVKGQDQGQVLGGVRGLVQGQVRYRVRGRVAPAASMLKRCCCQQTNST